MASHRDDLHQDLEELVSVRENIELLDKIADGQTPTEFPVSLHDIGEAWQLEVELPGVRQSDIQVAIEGTHVLLSGVKQRTPLDEEIAVLRNERSFGPFERRIGLPGEVHQEDIRAVLGNGILTVLLPKK